MLDSQQATAGGQANNSPALLQLAEGDKANLLVLATGSPLLGFIAKAFPVFRLWLGIIPIVLIGLALLVWGLFPHLQAYARWSQQRVGQLRAQGPAFWTAHRLLVALGPFSVFAVLVAIGAALA